MKYFWAFLAILYIIFPKDLISDGLGLPGRIDDLIILYFLIRYWLKFAKLREATRRNNSEKHHTYHHRNESSSNSTASNTESSNDPYYILGIQPDATQEEIHQAYRKLANQYHPDKVSHLGKEFAELSEKKFKEIQNAYQSLKKKK